MGLNLILYPFPSTFDLIEKYAFVFLDQITIEEELSNSIVIDSNFRSYRATLNKYVNSLNIFFLLPDGPFFTA